MNNRFLVDSKERKIGFDFFEVEKVDTERVFFVNIISAFTDNIDLKICKSRKVFLLNLEKLISGKGFQTNIGNANIEFDLPESVETEGFFIDKSEKNIYVIFCKNQYRR